MGLLVRLTIRYLSSLYFTVITCTTVGYGDIFAQNTLERIIVMVMMVGQQEPVACK